MVKLRSVKVFFLERNPPSIFADAVYFSPQCFMHPVLVFITEVLVFDKKFPRLLLNASVEYI